MKKYKHWLRIMSRGTKLEYKQYAEIKSYLNRYPEAKATLYLLETNLLDRIVLLECGQNYDDLDMLVNSFSHPLQRLNQRPAELINPQPFAIPQRLLKGQSLLEEEQ